MEQVHTAIRGAHFAACLLLVSAAAGAAAQELALPELGARGGSQSADYAAQRRFAAVNDVVSAFNYIGGHASELRRLMSERDAQAFDAVVEDIMAALLALPDIAVRVPAGTGTIKPRRARPDRVAQLVPDLTGLGQFFDRIAANRAGKADLNLLRACRSRVRQMLRAVPLLLPTVPAKPSAPKNQDEPLGQRSSRSGSDLPAVVRRALTFVPMVPAGQVVVLRPEAVTPYLLSWGYNPEAAQATIAELHGLAEFTIDHHFPIFVNAESVQYLRIVQSFEYGQEPDQAARVLASDLYHEYRHAACGEEERAALLAQLDLLERWRAQGVLTIADPYIAAKRDRLAKAEQAPENVPGPETRRGPC
jgi:hypothetical protein